MSYLPNLRLPYKLKYRSYLAALRLCKYDVFLLIDLQLGDYERTNARYSHLQRFEKEMVTDK